MSPLELVDDRFEKLAEELRAARVLGISVTACSTRLSRALQKLEKEVSAGVAA